MTSDKDDHLHDCVICGKEDSDTINGCDYCFACEEAATEWTVLSCQANVGGSGHLVLLIQNSLSNRHTEIRLPDRAKVPAFHEQVRVYGNIGMPNYAVQWLTGRLLVTYEECEEEQP